MFEKNTAKPFGGKGCSLKSMPLPPPPPLAQQSARSTRTRTAEHRHGLSGRFFCHTSARAVAGSRPAARRLRRAAATALIGLPLLWVLAAGQAQAQSVLSISAPADANEGDAGTTDKFFMVSLSSAASVDVTYTICFTSSGTATRGASDDFQTLNGGSIIPALFGQCIQNKTLSAGQTSDSGFGMRIRGDTDAEPDETVIAQITLQGNPAGVTLGTSTATYTILDDDTPAPEISVSLPISEGESRSDAGEKKVAESEGTTGIGFNLAADQPLPSALTVCVRVTESGGNRVASGNEGIQTVNMPSSVTNGSGTHTLTWTNTAADDQDSSVTVEVVPPSTVGCSADNDSYTVSSSDASDKLLIQDDEDTTVSLTSSDMTMTEGDASDTAVLTVSLDRRLYAGETIGVPIALATSTGARLPGSVDGGSTANHDFEVTAAAASMHSGVTLENALTANPRVVFTGHDSNTVQTATVTLTPVANRDDGDMAHEAITATLSSLGLTDTTVSGGVTAHASNNAATLTLEDDEAPPVVTCSAQNPVFSETRLRILENGETTYCVRLTTAPSGGSTTVTIGMIGGAATANPTTLTFTSSNYQTPQQVTVTGADDPGSHRNRMTQLTHTASGGGYSSQNLGRVRVDVDDAPEVEAYWYIKGGARIQRPHTITSTRGLKAWQNAAPGERIPYVVRLSNRPEPGGSVTVTATVPSDKRNLVGLSLTEGGAAQNTVRVEFKDRSPGAGTGCTNWLGYEAHEYFDNNGYKRTVAGRQPSESYDATSDTPWECWRMIYVVRKPASRNIDDTCADITHTAMGGGVRKVTVDTIRAHVLNPGRNRRGSRGQESQCRNLDGNTLPPQAAPATATPTPTEAVTNVQVTAVDDASASVTWDAVEHATSYDVSWSAESSDTLHASAGDLPGVTGTTTTIQHGASVPMTLTVTVTPEYVDKNGDTQQLASLAATATLAVGPDALSVSAQSTDSPTPACVSEALLADARKAAGETWRTSPGHVERWSRVLASFGVNNAYSSNPMTVAEAQAQVDRGLQRWVPVVTALECLEKVPAVVQAEAQAEAQVPTITVTAGSGVTEGTAAAFTLKANPVPAEELAVTVTVTQSGVIADTSALGERTVTLPAGQAEAAFTVVTLADETDELAGAVMVTVNEGTGYTVEDPGASASVVVEDDDATAVALAAPEGDLPEASGTKTLTLTLGRALLEGEHLVVPLAFAGTATLGTDYTLAAPKTTPAGVTYTHLGGSGPKHLPTVTFAGAAGTASAVSATLELATVADSVAEGEQETVTVHPGTPVATGLSGGAAASGSAGFAILEPPPEITITAKTETVVEGTEATFTLTASRAPGAELTVHLTVAEAEGSDFVATEQEGAVTATLAQGETEATFTVPTVDDTTDEPDGVVSATLAGDGEEGLHYTVAPAPEDTASVAVTDNDASAPASAPTFSVGDETVNEEVGMMYFTVRLDRAVQQTVKVTVMAQESTPVSARYGQDYYWWWEEGVVLTFHPGQTEKKTPVYVYNDNHDEDPETFEVSLSQPTGGAVIGDGVAVGTIVNSDPMPAAWLARFGRTVAEQALDGIAGRIAAPRTAGLQGAIAGQAMTLDLGSQGASFDGTGPGTSGVTNTVLGDSSGFTRALGTGSGGIEHDVHGFISQPAPSHSMTVHEALLGSHFTATGEQDHLGGSLALWGRVAHSSFDGQEGIFSLDGEATSALLGVDYARGTWLLGLALIKSDGDGDYRDTDPAENVCDALNPAQLQGMDPQARAVLCSGAVREGDGEIEATLTAAMPYVSLQVSQRLKLWGTLGYGTGDVTLKPKVGGSLKSDIDWTMAATGLRGDVIAPLTQGSGPALAITSDALWARTSSDKTHQLASSDSDVTRFRLGLEGSYRIATERGGHAIPKLEIGLRQDGGDAETGFGVELGGGLAWVDPSLGLSLDLSGRTLITHGADDLEDRGFAASLAFDPEPASERGLSLVLRQEMGGQAEGGLDALFRADPLEDRTESGSGRRWTAEAAYGMPAFSGRFTGSPHVGLNLAPDTRNYSLGWRLTPVEGSPDISFELKATRWENDASRPEHTIGADIRMQW